MSSVQNRRVPGLLGDFRLLVILFVVFRLMMLMAYQPLMLQSGERGVTTGGDFAYYYGLASQWDDGLLPFRDWWSEFPPLWPLLEVSLYAMLGTETPYATYAMALALVMLLFEMGNLMWVRRIGAIVHDDVTGLSLAWIYALLLAPVVFSFWTFEPMVVFFLLGGVWWLIRGRDVPGALMLGLGALTKFVPMIVIGAVIRFQPVRRAVQTVIAAMLVFIVPYGVLLALPQTREMTLPSLTAQFSKASYQTVWALIDGNMTTGVFGPVSDRVDVSKATLPQGNPAVVPGWLRLGVAGLIGLFVFARTRRRDERGFVAFVTITLLIFYLQSQGWSPQWLAGITPLVLLCFPTRNGVYAVVMLAMLTFAEYPVLFIRTGDTGGMISGELVLPFVLLISLRTIILLGICVALYRLLRQFGRSSKIGDNL